MEGDERKGLENGSTRWALADGQRTPRAGDGVGRESGAKGQAQNFREGTHTFSISTEV